ncbi:D-lactate dehydrogenase [Zalerion maritima]|uniref:D-lactate dehydrogenase n=1 Tax=Zalerion maritima TaxID=339359 RepID=A0AAD5RG57_9PEZI|nr:D-lactate dehydrogenase [Zalerion maritima]
MDHSGPNHTPAAALGRTRSHAGSGHTLRLAVFSAKPYDRQFLNSARQSHDTTLSNLKITYHNFALSQSTVSLARGCEAVCVFVNDHLDASLLQSLHDYGVRAILLRCAGYDNIDLAAAEGLGFFVANCAYSPESVAEFALALIQTLNRKTHRAYLRVREGNFNLDGLLGRTLCGKTAGIVGIGRIGLALSRILVGFGCRVIAYDPYGENPSFLNYGAYVGSLDSLLSQSDIVSLHCPLTPQTRHIINDHTLQRVKPTAMLVNTSRGGLIDTHAVVSALKDHRLGGLALDVYEGEESLFYVDHSGDIIEDDELARLRVLPNVLLCGHQAWFTEESLEQISECTLGNLEDYLTGRNCKFSLVHREKTVAATPQDAGQVAASGAGNGMH